MEWTDLAQYKSWWQVIVNAVMKFWVSKNVGNFFTNCEIVSFSKILCFIDLVGWFVGWLLGLFIGSFIGWLVGWLVGWLISWLISWLVGHSVDLVGCWLVGW